MTTNDNEKRRVTANDTTYDNEWQRMITNGIMNENEWKWVRVILVSQWDKICNL